MPAGIERDPARRRTGRTTREERARGDVDGGNAAAAAEHHVGVARAVIDDAPRLVVLGERDGEDRLVGEGDDVDLVAIGIGGDGARAVLREDERSSGDRRRSLRLGDGRTEVGLGSLCEARTRKGFGRLRLVDRSVRVVAPGHGSVVGTRSSDERGEHRAREMTMVHELSPS